MPTGCWKKRPRRERGADPRARIFPCPENSGMRMRDFPVGDFLVTVEGPYPCWVTITKASRPDWKLHLDHREIGDLRYALERVAREARERLGKDRDEVAQ